MMASTVEQAIREGELDQALAAVQDAVRAQPAKAEQRVSLFQLLAMAGEWAKALRQLNVLSDLDPKMELLAVTYRQLIACEGVRGEVFEGKRAPLCLGDPPDWYARLVEALRFDGSGQHAAAKELRDEAFATAQPSTGRIGDDTFAWLADADERLGPVLEALVGGRYFWIPFARVQRLEFDEPEDLRDLVWLPARMTWANSGEAVGFIPVRYCGSEREPDPNLRLGRRTEWRQLGTGSWCGLGQRMLATDQAEYALLDSRVITLEVTSDEVLTSDA
jgi:type VI secretion system protein ImpE